MSDVLMIPLTSEQETLLIPVTTVQADLVTQTDVIVYVPLASKTSHGIVKIGEGLNITTSGVLSLDESKITNAVTDLELKLRKDIDRIEGLISNAENAVSFDNYEQMVEKLNSTERDIYVIGQSVFIRNLFVPDVWIYGVSDEFVEYEFVDDFELESKLETEGVVQIGYYQIAALETGKIDLDNYVTTDTYQRIDGLKVFKEMVGIVNDEQGEIIYAKHINNNFLLSTSLGENIVNIDEQLRKLYFYNEPVALEQHVSDNYISFTSVQTLTDEQKETARNNIGAGTGSGTGESVMLVWWR